MHDLDDNTLLREYAEHASAPAFAELVSRHVDKIYSTALRHVRNPHHAEEITQAVFVILSQKAGKLGGKVILAGWLYQTARLASQTFLRTEIRRARREQEALMQSFPNENESDEWPSIAPLLDDALAGLGEKDRQAVVLRFFDGKSFGEVGAALGGSESAAKMRVNRALEKLRKFFAKRDVTLTATAIAGAVSANSVRAAPAGLAKTISAVAMAKGAAVSTSTLTLVKGALKLMAWTKIKTAVVISAGVFLVFGAMTAVVQSRAKTEPPQPAAKQTPVFEPIIQAWEQGNQADAISRFVAADWRARPLFAGNSALSLSENQFKALNDSARKAKSEEMLSRLAVLKQLAAAVSQAGRDTAAKGDGDQARRFFAALKQCGTDLESTDCMLMVRLVGKAFEKMADSETSKLK